MKTYEYIVNPKTGRKVSVYGKLGRSIIRNYMIGGGLLGRMGDKMDLAVKNAAKKVKKGVVAPSFIKISAKQGTALAKRTAIEAELKAKNQAKTIEQNKDNFAWKGISDNGKCRLCKEKVDPTCNPKSAEEEIYYREIADALDKERKAKDATTASVSKGRKAYNEALAAEESATKLVKLLQNICPKCVRETKDIEMQDMSSKIGPPPSA
jgi:hypothetical protein